MFPTAYTHDLEKNLSPELSRKLDELRELLKDQLLPETTDQKLLKFLIARKFDVPSAETMLRKHLTYWKKVGLHHMLYEYTPEEKSKYFATAPLGFDNEGALVRLLRVGVSDLKGLTLCHTKLDAILMAAHLLETDKNAQRKRFEKTGEGGDDKQIYIIDLHGLNWRLTIFRPLVQLFVVMLRLYEANYPESLKVVYVVNAPVFFSAIYNFVKSILPMEILNKVQILGADQIGPTITKHVDPSIIPKYLGGTRCDDDGNPYCDSLYPVKPGTPVPEMYYLKTCLEKDPEAKRATVMPQSVFSVKQFVEIPQSVLVWDFQTKENDIGMSLVLHRENAPPVTLIPTKKFDCHNYMESGRFSCEVPGTFEIIFDNTYSWWTKKELTYKTSLLKPGDGLDVAL